MNQKLAFSTFFSGLAVFFTSIGEFIANHHSWDEMTTPAAVGHIAILAGSLCVSLFGALGVQLPRNGVHGDRSTDVILENKKKEGE